MKLLGKWTFVLVLAIVVLFFFFGRSKTKSNPGGVNASLNLGKTESRNSEAQKHSPPIEIIAYRFTTR
jgi:hypothetical protein